jgi:hypothetical protein
MNKHLMGRLLKGMEWAVVTLIFGIAVDYLCMSFLPIGAYVDYHAIEPAYATTQQIGMRSVRTVRYLGKITSYEVLVCSGEQVLTRTAEFTPRKKVVNSPTTIWTLPMDALERTLEPGEKCVLEAVLKSHLRYGIEREQVVYSREFSIQGKD